MKKILCLIDTLGQGGAERQMVGLAVLLKKKGYIVELVAYHQEDLYGYIAREAGIEPIIISVRNNSFSKFLAVYKYLKRNGKFDCLIAYKSGPNIIGCLLKMVGVKCKVIVSERHYSRKVSKRDKLSFSLYRFADYIVPNSYSQSDFIKKTYKYLSKKIITITNFTDIRTFSPGQLMENERLQILTVARIARVKNILNYLEAISLIKCQGVKNIHFDWYGDLQSGEEDYYNEVIEKVSELDLDGFITFHPATINIIEEYQKSDIFCLPSFSEGYPNVICEAMSCGKPIICSSVCDMPQLVSDGVNGLLFNPNDVNDIYDKIVQMYSMPREILQTWGVRSREMAEKKFSEESFVEKYIKLIEE